MAAGCSATPTVSCTKASGRLLLIRLQDKKHGNGKYYFKEGKRYDGEFHLNEMHGQGTIYAKNGSVFNGNGCTDIGNFKMGKKDGKGYQKDPNGLVFEEDWELNVLISRKEYTGSVDFEVPIS